MPDRLVVDLGEDGQVGVLAWPEGALPEMVSRATLAWPLDDDALEDLRWYLEDYLLAPFGVWEDRGPVVREQLTGWGTEVFRSVFGVGSARDAYQRARDKGVEIVFRSAEPQLLALPWELMRDDGGGPVALGAGGISRSLPVADGAGTLEVPDGRLRVLMVISRPDGTADVGFQMVARPLLECLEAVRGDVELTVLRPPTFDALGQAVRQAADCGEPFHVVHFDGHGVMPGRSTGGGNVAGRPAMMTMAGEGVLAFERPGGGSDLVGASKVAAVLAEGRVPVVVLNACQSGAVGKELEAAVATALLKAGCAAVVAMAYSVYAVAAAEFMAEFYESLFAGASVGQAVASGRRRLFGHDGRPSPKGDMPLADWVVPVHYMRREVRFPGARIRRLAGKPSLDMALDQIRAAPPETAALHDPLAPVGTFVGRDDLFYLLEAAARLRVVVVSGTGGTGKTELAKGFARWWRDTGGVDDPRLVLWHSFEPGAVSFGLDGVITAIGLQVLGAGFARLPQAQRLETVKRLLGQCRALLIWDNFETVREMPDQAGSTPPLDAAGSARLREFLAWVRDHSASTVFITSRTQEDWLGQVGRIMVGGLNRAEAAQYAGHLLAPYPAAQRRREHRPFGELLDWLDGHPLAMRLTLPRLDDIDPAALLAMLQGTTSLLAEDGAAEERLSSLGACITYSFAHLAEPARGLLPVISLLQGVADANLLGVFSGVPGVPDRFAGVSRQDWSVVLHDAARVGLLADLGGGMYQIHPALPAYLAAGWRADSVSGYHQERRAGERAMCTAYAIFSQWATAQIDAGDAALAYAVIGLQKRALGVMLGYALDHQAWDEASAIVPVLDDYWDTRGFGGEAAAWADRILAATEDHDQAPGQAARSLRLHTIVRQANRQQVSGRPDQARQVYQQALAYLQGQPETEWTRANIAVVHHQLGITSYLLGRFGEAEEWCRKSLAIKEQLGNRPGMASSYHQLGVIAQVRGQLEDAEDWYRKSLAIEQELGNRPGMAVTYNQLGNVAHLRQQPEKAEDWYHRSLAIKERLGDRPGMALTYHMLGVIAQAGDRLEDAEGWYRKSLTIKEGLGDRPGMADTYHQLGINAYLRGRLREAEDWLQKSLVIEEEFDRQSGIAASYHMLGALAQASGRLEDADDWYRKSLAINQQLDDRPHAAITCAQLAQLAEDVGQARQALEWNIRCVTLIDQFPSVQTGTGATALARLARQLGTPILEETWQQVTGGPVPQPVRDYLTSHHDLSLV